MQTRWDSFIEAATGVMFGYCVSVAAGYYIYPFFDSSITMIDNMGITLCFTIISLTRTYVTRRVFNWLNDRKRKAVGMER